MAGCLTQRTSSARPGSAFGRAALERKLGVGALVLGATLSACLCNAQGIADPTRPAIDILTPGTSAEAAAPGATGGPTLQSVMITPTERVAIISGERVKLGSTYAGSRVVKITESEVVLRSSYGTETLRMYPDVAIKPVKTEPIKKKPVRKSARGDRS